MQLEVLEVGVPPRLRRNLRDVQLVVDVAVEPEAFLVDRGDGLARELERDRLVPQPAAADRLRDDGALVADERIVQPGLERERPRGAEHPPRHEHDVDAGRVRRAQRVACALVQHDVLADQRAVEVAGDRSDVAGKVRREVQPCGLVRKSTRSFKSFAGSDLYDFGITFFGHGAVPDGGHCLPTNLFGSTIESWTNAVSGCFACLAYVASLSRSGPICPFASGPAGVYVWHAPQPCAAKIPFPGASCLTVPTTVCGAGETTPLPPQPASASTARQAAVRAPRRRMRRESTDSNRSRAKEPSVPSRMMSTGVSLTSRETTTATSIASTPGRRGLFAATKTSTTRQPRKSAAENHALVTVAHERCRRCPKSPSSDPLPTACVTWLEPPSAASIPISAKTSAAAPAPASAVRRHVSGDGRRRKNSTANAAAKTTRPPPSEPALLQPSVTSASAPSGTNHLAPPTTTPAITGGNISVSTWLLIP